MWLSLRCILQVFAVEYDVFGEMRTHELKPGGSEIPVTAENRCTAVSMCVLLEVHCKHLCN